MEFVTDSGSQSSTSLSTSLSTLAIDAIPMTMFVLAMYFIIIV